MRFEEEIKGFIKGIPEKLEFTDSEKTTKIALILYC